MAELPPPLILPDHYVGNRPAIIRAHEGDLDGLQQLGRDRGFKAVLPGIAPVAAGKSFPQVLGTNSSEQLTGSGSHPVALPSSIAAGDLLLVMWCSYSTNTTNNVANTPSGWSQVPDIDGGSLNFTNGWRMVWFYKIAAGDEGSTVTVITPNSSGGGSAHTSYRIGNHNSSPIGQNATGSSAAPDPASLSPSWGLRPTLWISGVVKGSLSSPPSGYGGTLMAGGAYWSAHRQAAVATEDPGAWTASGSSDWLASTLAVGPA